jgi:hypothetical protein
MQLEGEDEKMTKGSMKRVVAAAAFALASTAPFSAHADCDQFGTALSLFQFPGLSQLFIVPPFAADHQFVCNISNPQLGAAAVAAAAVKSSVFARGDAASCPTTGVVRFMGNCTLVFVNP